MAKKKPVKKSETKDENYLLRITGEQRAAWQAQADKDRRKLADWIRLTLDKAAGR